ncbi:hypothetical protein ACWC5C_38575 [Streptomyces sp. NPDC001700]
MITSPGLGRKTETHTALDTALNHAARCHDCGSPSESCEVGLALLYAHYQAWAKLHEQPHPTTPRRAPGHHANPDQDDHRTKILGDITYSVSLAALIAFPAFTYAHR